MEDKIRELITELTVRSATLFDEALKKSTEVWNLERVEGFSGVTTALEGASMCGGVEELNKVIISLHQILHGEKEKGNE